MEAAPALRYLTLRNPDGLPSNLGDLPHLTCLELEVTGLSGAALPPSLSRLRHLSSVFVPDVRHGDGGWRRRAGGAACAQRAVPRVRVHRGHAVDAGGAGAAAVRLSIVLLPACPGLPACSPACLPARQILALLVHKKS